MNPPVAIDLSLVSLVLRADIVVQAVMALLLLFSVFSWMIIFEKWAGLRLAAFRMRRFEKRYRSAEYLEQFYDKERGRQDNPLAEIFAVAMYEYNKLAYRGADLKTPKTETAVFLRERVSIAAERVKERVLEQLESRLTFLATVASSAPFIGLFGTVWGIVHSFQAIAETKNTTLAVVAPGIAEALLATGIGLFAAIPAVIFYNMFSGHIRHIHNKMTVFCEELPVILSQK